MEEDAIDLLTKIGLETSLRYSINLITTATLICSKRKGKKISIGDVKKSYELFVDVKRSTKYLREFQQEYMFNEAINENMDES